jgi:hypothetical protein
MPRNKLSDRKQNKDYSLSIQQHSFQIGENSLNSTSRQLRNENQISAGGFGFASKQGSDMRVEHLEGTFLQFEQNGKKLLDMSKQIVGSKSPRPILVADDAKFGFLKK